MILHNLNTPTYLEQTIQTYWIAFKKDILKSSNIEWNDENYKGTSFAQWKTMQYYNLLYLLILIYLEMQQTTGNTWSYYVSKYNLVKLKKCFDCDGIDFNKGLTIFSFPLVDSEGVGGEQIELTLQVDLMPIDTTPIIQVNLSTLLSTFDGTINNIN